MKKIISLISGVFVVATVLSSCERDISILNNDPKHPETVLSSNLVSSTEQALFDQMVTPSVNFNVARFFTQQWTETQYIDETNYNFVTRNQPQNHYNTMMRRVLQPLKQAKGYLPAEVEDAALSPAQVNKVKANKAAINEFISIFVWKNLVETFGNIPYSEALKTGTGEEILQPKYDDAATIYADLVLRLNAAIASVDTSMPGYEGEIIYSGNMTQWLKMANSVKLEMGLTLSDVNPGTAKAMVESAYQAGVIMNAEDDFAIQYESGQFSNPMFQNLVASGRNDFIPSDVYMNNLKAKSDPRLPTYFTKDKNGAYTGGPYGNLATYANFSHIQPSYTTATAKGYIIDQVEVKYQLAEAAARNFNVGGTATALYAIAVNASMKQNGVSAADGADYLAAHPYDAVNWKKSIGEESWVAMHNRGFEAWNFWRRLDFPVLTKPAGAESLVYRMPYSFNEYSTNKENVTAAATAIGGDKYGIKLFFDKF